MKQNGERVSINSALERLVILFGSWGVEEDDYVLVDEFAYVLQGYEVKATEIESGHLDVYINPQKLPWKDKGERSIVPPKDSKEMDNWVSFMQETGYSLDMLRGKPEIFGVPTVNYELPNGKQIKLMRAYEMTAEFVRQTLMHYSLEDVGERKIKEWLNKLQIIQEAAQKKNDTRLAKLCKDKLAKSKRKWHDILDTSS